MGNTDRIILKVLVDCITLLFIGVPILAFFIWGKPYERGFFCDDESLMHPFHESTVKSHYLYAFALVLQIILIFVAEFLQIKLNTQQPPEKSTTFGNSSPIWPQWFSNVYHQFVVFAFGVGVNQLITDVTKYSIGRLRPHFLSVCQPLMDDGTNCSDPINFGRYIEHFRCLGIGSSVQMLKEMRLSFPSGHTSFAAYTSVYCAIYLQIRMPWRGSKLLKHFVQFLLLLLAWYTGMSRISDYKHHWSDVLAGAVLGTFCAFIISFCVSNLFVAKNRTVLPEAKYELKMCL